MTNYEIAEKLTVLIRNERHTTYEILQMLNLAMEKRTYVELGYPTLFEWLVKGFGYSNAAAFRRIEAARLLKAVPETSTKLKSGKVNLSTLSKAQTIISHQEKLSGLGCRPKSNNRL